MQFRDRNQAGSKLAGKLLKYKNTQAIVFALPRGGLPVAFEIANTLHLPMSVVVARKIGAPNNPEFGIGAISEEGVLILDQDNIKNLEVGDRELDELIVKEIGEVRRRVMYYRNNSPLPNLSGKEVILVDDGLATGVTAKAAIKALQKKEPQKVIFAVPVCSAQSLKKIKRLVDKVVYLKSDPALRAIGSYYKNFDQITDEEVIYYLHANRPPR